MFALIGAKADERQTLLGMLEAEPDVMQDRADQTLIDDKHHYGRGFEASLADGNITLLRLAQPAGPSCDPGPPTTTNRNHTRPGINSQFGRYQRWALVALQSQIWSWVPSVVLLPGSSRHRPDWLLNSAFVADRYCQPCAPVPLQPHSCTFVPLAVPLWETSRHLSIQRTVPSWSGPAHRWPSRLLQDQICTEVPSAVPAYRSSRHLRLTARQVVGRSWRSVGGVQGMGCTRGALFALGGEQVEMEPDEKHDQSGPPVPPHVSAHDWPTLSAWPTP
jgi:hypothetical protein